MAFICTFFSASSLANVFVSRATPSLLAVYAGTNISAPALAKATTYP